MAHRKGRSALTAVGIVLGVAIFFGVLVTNASTATGVDRLIADFTGNADVIVRPTGAFDADLPTGVVARLRSLPGVEAAAADLDLSSRSAGREVVVSGVDPEYDKIRRFHLATGRLFAPGAEEVVLPKKLAGELKVGAGERVRLRTPSGPRDVPVTGILAERGAGRSQDTAFTSLAAARVLAGKGDVVGSVSLVLRAGEKTERWIKGHSDDLGPGLRFENSETLAQGFKDFLKVLGAFFAFIAVITLFVGSFLIYLTLSMAVVERTRVYGTMRALGATRGQIVRVVMAEAAALGAVSTLAGLVFGLAAAKGLLVLVGKLFEIEFSALSVRPGAVLSGLVVGLGTTLISSIAPAVRAGRLPPVLAMKGDYAAELRLGRGWIAGVTFLSGGLAARLGAPRSGALSAVGTIAILLGAVLLVPLVLRPLASVLGRLTNRIAPGVGNIAVLHLVKERSRSAYTLALIMVVMAMLFAIGGLSVSVTGAINESLDKQFGADLLLSGRGPVDAKAEDELRAVPGVGAVTSQRFATTKILRGKREPEDVFVRIIDPATYFEVTSYSWVDGGDRSAAAGLRSGGVLLAESYGKRRGARITLDTAQGPHPFTVVATYAQFGGGTGIVMGLADARKYLGAGRPSGFLLDLEPDAKAGAVRKAIRTGPARRYALQMRTPSDLKSEAQREVRQFFNVFYAILLVAVVVGLLSLANTLAVSVLRRFREIGILRAIGVTRGQTWRMVLVESATLGLAAFALSLPLGWLLSVLVVRGSSESFDLSLPYRYPAAWVPIVGALGLVMAVLAAVAPGRRAARLQVVGALQYE